MLAMAVVVALHPGPAAAQALLYDPLPPPGSAYLRVVNARSAPVRVEAASLPAVTLGTLPAERVGAYRVVENVAGRTLSVSTTVDGTRGETRLELAPGSFVTLMILPDGRASSVVDETQFNQVRAKIAFYNATADCADGRLAIDPGGPAVFEGVAPGASRMRAVNPVTTQVKAGCTGVSAPAFLLNGLEPGGRFSVWLMRLPQPTAFLSRDATQVWKP
jgi:hypothetical protein